MHVKLLSERCCRWNPCQMWPFEFLGRPVRTFRLSVACTRFKCELSSEKKYHRAEKWAKRKWRILCCVLIKGKSDAMHRHFSESACLVNAYAVLKKKDFFTFKVETASQHSCIQYILYLSDNLILLYLIII